MLKHELTTHHRPIFIEKNLNLFLQNFRGQSFGLIAEDKAKTATEIAGVRYIEYLLARKYFNRTKQTAAK